MSERLRIYGSDRPVVGDLVFETGADPAKKSPDVVEESIEDEAENGGGFQP